MMQTLAFCLLALCAAGVFAEELKYNDCGSDSYAARIASVGVVPWPVKAKEGFSFTVSARGAISRAVGASSFKLNLRRKVLGFWVPIPCIAGYGSCTYDNGCQLLEALLEEKEIPESCTGIPQQQLVFDRTLVLPEIPGPLAWLVSGEYQAKGDFHDANGPVLCLELEGRLDS